MTALLRYHLRRVFKPALLFVLAAFAAYVLYTFRFGGAWMGNAFGYYTALHLWHLTTTLLVLFLALLSPPIRAAASGSDPLFLTRPSLGALLKDRIARFIALLSPFLMAGLLLSLYMAIRLPDSVHAYAPPPFKDPLSLKAIWQLFLFGPLPGVAFLLSLGEAVGTFLYSNGARIILIGAVLITDGINRLSSPWLSPSGTALALQQSRTGPILCDPVYTSEAWNVSFCPAPALWGDYLFTPNGGALSGPVTAVVAHELVVARVTLALLAVVIVLATGWWHHRNLCISPADTSTVR